MRTSTTFKPGEGHPLAKLTDELVRAIRTDPRSPTVVAAELGVTESTVRLVRRRKLWGHVQ